MTSAHVKRPLNAFMVWSQQERRRMLTQTNNQLSSSHISRVLGERWKRLDESERELWKFEATRLKEEHEAMYPDYKYKPKRRISSSGSSRQRNSSGQSTDKDTIKIGLRLDSLDEEEESLDDLELDFVDEDTLHVDNMHGIIKEVMEMDQSEVIMDTSPNKENVTTTATTPSVSGHTQQIHLSDRSQTIQMVAVCGQPMPPLALQMAKAAPLRLGSGLVPNILKSSSSSKKGLQPVLVVSQSSPARVSVPPVVRKTKAGHTIIPTGRQPLKADKSFSVSGSAVVKRPTLAATGLHHDHTALLRPNNKTAPKAAPVAVVGDHNCEAWDICLPERETRTVETTWSDFIGDLDRTWAVFEKLDKRTGLNAEAAAAAAKSEQFMSRLDRWGADGMTTNNEGDDNQQQLPFGGLLSSAELLCKGGRFCGGVVDGELMSATRELARVGVPPDWADPELFGELDRRHLAESVFLEKWLPKCAPTPRHDAYRTFLRQVNKKDPAFNIVW